MGREFAYQAVYRYLEALVEEAQRGGQLRLPSLRALSRRLRVSLSTVQTAYGLLEHEGRVLSVPKSGYFAQAVESHRCPATPMQPSIERALLAHERRLARQRARSLCLHSAGSTRLRKALAERYTRSSRQCWLPEDVHLAPDVQALLETLLAALALHGSTVLVTSPCCWRLWRALQRAGVQIQELPLNHLGSPDLGRLARVLGQGVVRMVVMPSCLGMPLGLSMSPEDQQQIARLLALHPVWLLENDLDSEHCFAGPVRSRLRDWVDPHWLLVMGSLEAAVGAEAPYAYVLGRPAALVQTFAQRDFQLAPLRQQALAQMLGMGEIDEQMGRQRVELQRRMQLLCQQLQRHLGRQTAFAIPEGGRVVWLRLGKRVPARRIVAALDGSVLRVEPGEQFGVQGRYQQYLALSWVDDQPEPLQDALCLLAQALKVGGAH
ncbi:aminotransferase class I/II-fold pyridoxal phosphate-dependent enzyme [Pseudomonas sp. NPDC089752]|uniref:aminotransferase class I/II-fold pyridoxal phosphate-dependent enzyme n=1 Tax=Pseudomonas sp. NPDC089752 TaxID=3364472 RepID=UPI00380B3326